MSEPAHSSTAIYLPLVLMAGIVIVLDQVTKQLALGRLADAPYEVVDGVLSLRLTYNSGGAFGLFQGFPWVFLIATVAIAIGILIGVRRLEDRRWVPALGLVLGGGLGNAFDRLVRDTNGAVVDFIDFQVWPVFNVADMAIVTGSLIILLVGWRADRSEAEGSAT